MREDFTLGVGEKRPPWLVQVGGGGGQIQKETSTLKKAKKATS